MAPVKYGAESPSKRNLLPSASCLLPPASFNSPFCCYLALVNFAALEFISFTFCDRNIYRIEMQTYTNPV
ncbi:hypothetical protein N0Y54_13155, partial [Nostoc punctiforme UO1]